MLKSPRPYRKPRLTKLRRNAQGEGRAGQNAQFAGTGQRADSVHLVEKLCSFYHLDIHRHTRERAGMGDRGGSAVGARYIVRGGTTRHNCTVLNKNIEGAASARPLPLESLARGCSGSRFFCAPGPAVQGKSSRAPSPARPSLTLTTPCSLLFARSRPSRWRNALKHYWEPRLTKTTRNA